MGVMLASCRLAMLKNNYRLLLKSTPYPTYTLGTNSCILLLTSGQVQPNPRNFVHSVHAEKKPINHHLIVPVCTSDISGHVTLF